MRCGRVVKYYLEDFMCEEIWELVRRSNGQGGVVGCTGESADGRFVCALVGFLDGFEVEVEFAKLFEIDVVLGRTVGGRRLQAADIR